MTRGMRRAPITASIASDHAEGGDVLGARRTVARAEGGRGTVGRGRSLSSGGAIMATVVMVRL
jgi:hypothetical protein